MRWLDVWCLLIRLDIRTSGQRQGKRFAEGLREDAWIWRQDTHSYPPKFSDWKMPWNWTVSVGSMAMCVVERLLFYKPTAMERQVWETCQVLATWQQFDAAMALLLFPFIPPKFNMEPENDGFQKESPFPGTSLQVPCTFHYQSLTGLLSTGGVVPVEMNGEEMLMTEATSATS